MNRIPLPGRRATAIRRAAAGLAAVTLLAAMLATLGAGPDEPAAASAAAAGRWQVFEGHAFADSHIVPEGVALIACLGGCQQGYVSEPVAIGKDGRYSNLRVEPGDADRADLPDADLVTFWLAGHGDDVRAVQSWLFEGNGSTRELHLSFKKLPVPARSDSAGHADAVVTDLTVPDAGALNLTPDRAPRAYVNSWAYAGIPVMPGLVIVVGLLLAVIGVGLLARRRRLVW